MRRRSEKSPTGNGPFRNGEICTKASARSCRSTHRQVCSCLPSTNIRQASTSTLLHGRHTIFLHIFRLFLHLDLIAIYHFHPTGSNSGIDLGVDLLQGEILGFNPEVRDDEELNNVPCAIDDVCLPANRLQRERPHEDAEQPVHTDQPSQYSDRTVDSRSASDGKCPRSHAIASNGKIENLWSVQHGERRDCDGVAAIEEEDGRHSAICA